MNYVVAPKGSVLMFDSVVLSPETYEQLCHRALDERIQALEEIVRLAKQLLSLSPFEDWEWAEVHRDLGEALERVDVQAVKDG